MDFTFGILGIIGGIVCACGDLLLDLKGKNNKKLGKHEIINSNWEEMKIWRFKLSILLVMVGVPLYFLGLTSMASQLSIKNSSFGLAFWIISIVGSIGGFFIHVFICLLPIIYKTMQSTSEFPVIEKVISTIYDAIKIPFLVMYILLVGITSLIIMCAIIMGYLSLSPFAILLTPLSLLIIGVTLRRIKYDWFYDLPGIIMPSIGLSMIGLMSVLNMV